MLKMKNACDTPQALRDSVFVRCWVLTNMLTNMMLTNMIAVAMQLQYDCNLTNGED